MEQSDLLIHLVDASNPQIESHITSVLRILGELQLDSIPRLTGLNKMDLVDEEELSNLCRTWNALPISAISKSSLTQLVNEISDRLNEPAFLQASQGASEPG